MASFVRGAAILGFLLVEVAGVKGVTFESQVFGDDSFSSVRDLSKTTELARPDLDFRLVGIDGLSHTLLREQDASRTLVVAFLPNCASSRELLEVLTEFALRPESKGTRLLLIDPETGDRATAHAIWAESKLRASLLFDPLQIVSKSLQFSRQGDFVILDEKGRVEKSGAFLEKQALIQRCAVEFWRPRGERRHNQFIQSFEKACLYCHSEKNGLDLFRTLKDVRGWSRMITKTIRLMRMPGWPEPHDGAGTLMGVASEEDLRRILWWVEEDPTPSSEDEKSFDLARRRVRNHWGSRALSRSPDVVLQLKEPIHVPATGDLPYSYVQISDQVKEDLWLEGIEIDTNLNVTHHINLLYSKQPLTPEAIARINQPSTELEPYVLLHGVDAITPVSAKVDGKAAEAFRVNESILATIGRKKGVFRPAKGLLWFIPKGSYIFLQLHLAPSGRPEIERTRIKLYKNHDPTRSKIQRRFCIVPKAFTIPPNKERFVVETRTTLTETIVLQGFWVHMHYRGVAAEISVRLPNQTTYTRLFSGPYHQFKMQMQHDLISPLKLPSGSEIFTRLTYNNSRSNSANPDPDAEVPLGTKTLTHEMHLPRFVYISAEGSQ